MLNLYVVGCGGIGGYLIDMLPMAICSLSLDLLQDGGLDITRYLTNAGNCSIPCCVDRLVLIDGDTFNPRNALRQGCGAGSKLVQRMKAINSSMVRQSYLQRMKLVGFNSYVSPSNISEIIPEVPPENPDNQEFLEVMSRGSFNLGTAASGEPSTVVFLCVDNVKTRYEVSKYVEGFKDVLVLNGGNEKTTGHVTVYERSNGRALDPNIYEVYPNINDTSDKRPDEEACTNIAPKHDQIAVTNSIVANVMLACFNKWVREGLTTEDSRGRESRKNEVLIDTNAMTMISLYHPLTGKKGE